MSSATQDSQPLEQGRLRPLPATGPSHTGGISRVGAILASVILLLLALRLVHLTADTPGWVSPTSAGEYVDEGYKTLSPRNLTLYGRTHWHPHDDYKGWMRTSPVTNWSYFAAFQVGQPDLATARLVTLGYFALLLGTFALTFRHRYPPALIAGGLLLLGLDGTLFFFSRIALFEIPIAFFLYGGLFLLARARDSAVWWPLAAALLASPLLAFGLKLSALVYLAPIWFALLVRAVVLQGLPRSPRFLAGLGLAAAGLGLMMGYTHWLWSERLHLDPLGLVRNLFSSSLPATAPFLLLAGWLAALHLVLTRPREIVASPYRSAVLALALLGPLVFALFPYDPPRYYVPILPAYGLVICEWFSLQRHRIAAPVGGVLAAIVAVLGLTIWFHVLVRAGNAFVLSHLPISVGDAPGIGKRGLLIVGVPLAFALAALAWRWRSRTFSGPVVQTALVASLVLWGALSIQRVGAFLLEPRFAGDEVRAAIREAVPAQSSIIGDWAPFFALGTDLRPLYMNRVYNRAPRIAELQPDYFLHSETEDSARSLESLMQNPAVTLGDPVLTATYNDRFVLLYPLQHQAVDPAGGAPLASGSSPLAADSANPTTP